MSEVGELLRKAIDHRLAGLHVSVPGTIVSYDAARQTCSVSPQAFLLFGAEEIRLPNLDDVPVCWLRGGGFIVAMPLTAGDVVDVRFSDRALDDWRGAGQSVKPTDPRTHALADAYVVPMGIQPDANASLSAALAGDDLAIVRDGGAGLTVKANGDVVLGDVVAGVAAQAVTSDPLIRAQLAILLAAVQAISTSLAATNALAVSGLPSPATPAALAIATPALAAAQLAVSALSTWPAPTATTKTRAV